MLKMTSALPRAMLALGGLMILIGLGMGAWTWANAARPVNINDAGAVVLAVTAQPMRPTASPTPAEPTPTLTSAPLPTQAANEIVNTPDYLTDRASRPERPSSTPVAPTSTPLPPTPTPTPTPTPGLPAAAESPNRIVAPAIKLDAAVLPMDWKLVDHKGTMAPEWIVPANAAGWHTNSALPGHQENVVLSGHNNIDGKVFRYVEKLEPGNEITLYAGGVTYVYTVTEKYILKEAGMPLEVRQKNAQWIMSTGDERLTLVTCWPYQWPGNTHRVIVVARPPAYFQAPQNQDRANGTG